RRCQSAQSLLHLGGARPSLRSNPRPALGQYLAINPQRPVTSHPRPQYRYHSLESGAIVEYLIEAYDTDHRLRFAPEHQNRIMRNSGSTFRQQDKVRTWAGGLGELKLYHSEQVYSAIERYIKEVNRVTGILDVNIAAVLAVQGLGSDGPWLVGNKLSCAESRSSRGRCLLVRCSRKMSTTRTISRL
ncbi:hypothetical protein LIPSTDRAFT_332694, partial [Lipomyces starkeyi NRRL Y-11557]